MSRVVPHSLFCFRNRLIHKFQGAGSMSTLVMRGYFQVATGIAQVVESSTHFRLSIFSGLPVSTPSATSPITPAPTSELSAVDRTTFHEFEHPHLAIRAAGKDAEHLFPTVVRIDSEGAISHAKWAIGTGQFAQTIGDVHVMLSGAILRAQNDVLPFIALRPEHERQ